MEIGTVRPTGQNFRSPFRLETGTVWPTGRDLQFPQTALRAETGTVWPTGQNLWSPLRVENSVDRGIPCGGSIFWNPLPSFSLVDREPTRSGLVRQSGSPRHSALGVERQRSASRTEVEDFSLDLESRRVVPGEISPDTNPPRKEVERSKLDVSSTNRTVRRERSQATQKSQMSSHLHSDGGLQDVLPRLEEMLEQLKNNEAPALSWSQQQQHLQRHQRSTERRNKTNQLHASCRGGASAGAPASSSNEGRRGRP